MTYLKEYLPGTQYAKREYYLIENDPTNELYGHYQYQMYVYNNECQKFLPNYNHWGQAENLPSFIDHIKGRGFKLLQ